MATAVRVVLALLLTAVLFRVATGDDRHADPDADERTRAAAADRDAEKDAEGLRDAVVDEMTALADALRQLDQSYSIRGTRGHGAFTAGSGYRDPNVERDGDREAEASRPLILSHQADCVCEKNKCADCGKPACPRHPCDCRTDVPSDTAPAVPSNAIAPPLPQALPGGFSGPAVGPSPQFAMPGYATDFGVGVALPPAVTVTFGPQFGVPGSPTCGCAAYANAVDPRHGVEMWLGGYRTIQRVPVR